jgi:hypothetical protein
MTTRSDCGLFLSPPVAGTEIIVFRGDGTNTATVRSSQKAPVNGVENLVITLENRGDAMHFIASEDNSTWYVANRNNMIHA